MLNNNEIICIKKKYEYGEWKSKKWKNCTNYGEYFFEKSTNCTNIKSTNIDKPGLDPP